MPNASSALSRPTGFHLDRSSLSQDFLWRCLNPPLTMWGRDSKADHGPSFSAIYVCLGRWLWEGGGRGSVYVFSLRLCSAWLPTAVQEEELPACMDPWNTPTPAAPSFQFVRHSRVTLTCASYHFHFSSPCFLAHSDPKGPSHSATWGSYASLKQ